MNSSDGLCSNCTQDRYLARSVRKTGSRLTCVGCKKTKKCILLDDLADQVESVITKHFDRCDSIDHGDSLKWIVQEIASVEPEIADRIIEQMSPTDEERYRAFKDGDELFIDDGSTYEDRPAYTGEFDYLWQSFCFNIKHSARFFSDRAASRLDELLRGIETLKTPDGKHCVRTIKPGDPESTLVRGREALTPSTILEILRDPATNMGPPPGSRAKPGRMNPAGISVFYGAFDAETCIAEIRPPVGGTAFTALFRLTRPINIVDLTVLEDSIHGVTWLDPAFDHVTEQWSFLSRFHQQISRPVLAHEAETEFIPTQVIAEYLALRFTPSLDGVIYGSTQTGSSGLNIALFHHASGVSGVAATTAPERTAGVEVTIDDDSLVVREPLRVNKKAPDSRPGMFFDVIMPWEEPVPADHPDVEVAATLEVDPKSLKFWRVTSTEHRCESLHIVDMRKG